MAKNYSKFIPLLLILIVGFAVYSNSLTNEFLWDDELLVVANEYIKELGNIPGFFTKSITYGTAIESNLYRPLQMLSYALNYAGCRLDVRAYHLTNIGIHVLAALMLYWLTRLISENKVLSLIAALLFISHPIHTEAVTYISGRADPLVALFILCSVICYIKYSDQAKKLSFYFLSITLYLFALLSKEIALILPVLLITYDYIYREQKRFSFRPHLPFFLLALTYIALRKTIFNFPVNKTVIDQFTFFERIPAVFKSLAMYFEKLLFPLNLHMEYEPIIPSITDIRVILGVVIAIILIVLAIIYRKKQRLVSFSLAWFLINYLPISNIYPLNAFFAEHWIYLPSVGLFILGGWMAVKLCEKGKIFKWLTYLALACLLVGNSWLTVRQNQYWSNPEHFYKRTLKYAPRSSRVYSRLALFYFRTGMIDKGIEQSRKALEITSDYILAYKNIVAAYIIKGRYDQAIDLCAKALMIDPGSDILHSHLGVAYLAKGWNEKAIIEFKKSLSINPDNAETFNNLGSTYANIEKKGEAIAAFKNALKIKPDYPGAHYNLARAYYDITQYDLAITHCDRAIELGFKVEPELLKLLKLFR